MNCEQLGALETGFSDFLIHNHNSMKYTHKLFEAFLLPNVGAAGSKNISQRPNLGMMQCMGIREICVGENHVYQRTKSTNDVTQISKISFGVGFSTCVAKNH